MDIAVPSRFACLKIEEDDFRPSGGGSKKKPENKQGKKPGSAAREASKTSWTTTSASRKKGSTSTAAEFQKPKSAAKKGKKVKEEQEKNWDEWQRKDAKFVNEVFESEMQNAILQSKLEFEQHKKTAPAKSAPEQSQGKKKKVKTMSLDQFLEPNKEAESKDDSDSTAKENDKNFFQEVVESTKKVITKEKVEQNRKKRQEAFEEVISLAQCQEKLESERSKNATLEKELEDARKEIALVKKRNTTLCSMLSQGEMKDKAEVLLELERLTVMKEELTEEVTNLHKLLEQERSNKNPQHGSQTEVHSKHSKDKIKKKKH